MREASLTRAEEIAEGLYPHQIEGIAFLLGRRRALLADDMGLGKTRQSVIAMVEAEGEGPYLVICPASIKRNWAREIEIVFRDAEPVIVGPGPIPSTNHCGWIIVNYEILGKNLDKLLEFDWKGVVFDEAHYLKNYQSQRSRNASKLVKEIKDSIVEGSILIPGGAAALQLDVLSELKRMMNALSVQTTELEEPEIHDVLRKAGEAYLEENAAHLREATRAQLRPYSEEAIRTLARVLAGPERSIYHAESSSQKGKFYTLEVVGVDVTCDCPGFTHRGSCRHVRPLKSALVAGERLPEGYKQVSP